MRRPARLTHAAVFNASQSPPRDRGLTLQEAVTRYLELPCSVVLGKDAYTPYPFIRPGWEFQSGLAKNGPRSPASHAPVSRAASVGPYSRGGRGGGGRRSGCARSRDRGPRTRGNCQRRARRPSATGRTRARSGRRSPSGAAAGDPTPTERAATPGASGCVDATRRRCRFGHARSGIGKRRAYASLGCRPSPFRCVTGCSNRGTCQMCA